MSSAKMTHLPSSNHGDISWFESLDVAAERSRSHFELLEASDRTARVFQVTDDDIQNCATEFLRELNLGLQQQTDNMCQFPTYITRVAYGTEKGICLSVDLGGTNFRVCSVVLHGDSTYDYHQTKVPIPKDLMLAAEAKHLFSFIAEQVKIFLESHHQEQLSQSQTTLNLGFCFSFPIDQRSINSGILLRWTKGFDIEEIVGADVCGLLQAALDRLQLPVRVSALVNDGAATIMTRAYTLPLSSIRTSIGAIFGTGTNGVYLEQLPKITKSIGEHDTSTGEMFISTEWGSFDNKLSVLPITKYDMEVDAASLNKGNQRFEKLVSGMFLGELLRITILELYDGTRVNPFSAFHSQASNAPLFTRWSVDASILSTAADDNTTELSALRHKIHEVFGVEESAVSITDALAIKRLASAIGMRAARLAGMALGALILQSGKLQNINPVILPTVTICSREPHLTPNGPRLEISDNEDQIVDVGVDGSVIELYPNFEQHMREAMRVIKGIGAEAEQRIRMGLVKDGSGIGAAIVALLAAQ